MIRCFNVNDLNNKNDINILCKYILNILIITKINKFNMDDFSQDLIEEDFNLDEEINAEEDNNKNKQKENNENQEVNEQNDFNEDFEKINNKEDNIQENLDKKSANDKISNFNSNKEIENKDNEEELNLPVLDEFLEYGNEEKINEYEKLKKIIVQNNENEMLEEEYNQDELLKVKIMKII